MSAHRAGRALVVLAALLLLPACARPSFGLRRAAPEPTPYQRALQLLEEGAVAEAHAELRLDEALCAPGEPARWSHLLLASLWIDPRNVDADPDSAAVLAAGLLSLPEANSSERAIARSLYLMALELGGGTVSSSPCAAERAELLASLPVLGRESLAQQLARLEHELELSDSLVSELRESAHDLASRVKELEGELLDLRAELQRIRRLLGTGLEQPGANPGPR